MFNIKRHPDCHEKRSTILCFCLIQLCLFVTLAAGLSSAQETPVIRIALDNANNTPQTPEAVQNVQTRSGFFPWLWKTLTDEANITAGVGVLQLQLKVKRLSDGAQATMVQRDRSTLFLSYSTRPSFFKNSNFGYTVMVNYADFDMTQQETANDALANLGTEVEGKMIYAVPTLYYQWGEHRHNGTFVRLGVGLGVGAATYTGTAQLTNGQTVSASSKSYAPRLTVSDFLEARWHHVGISISYAAPRIYGDTYDIKVSNFSASVGYTYYF